MIVESNSINAIDAQECHYSECVFQTKPGAPLGRCCMNLSKNDLGFILNTPESKDGADLRYGKVTSPTIVDIAIQIVKLARRLNIPISKLVATKDDISKAHNQQKYSIIDAKRSCCEIAGTGLTIVYTRCLFGDNLSNGVFDVVARGVDSNIVTRMVKESIDGVNIRYVDDTNTFSTETDILSLQAIILHESERAYGVGEAINMKKRVNMTKQVVNIGFYIDLEKGTCRPDDKGLEKLFIAFMCIFKMDKPMTLVERQVVAGVAQAYCKCMKGMSEFVDPLHKFCVGSEFELRSANAAQRQCAQHWQAALMATFEDYSKWELPLEIIGKFHKDSMVLPRYKFISDASELAAGIFIHSSETGELLVWSQVLFGWGKDFKQKSKNNLSRSGSSAQNLREFMSTIFMMIMLAHSEPPSNNAIVELWGDNGSALSWVREHRCKSGERSSQLAFIASSLCIQSTNIFTHHTTQIKSEEMGIVDDVSRDKRLETLPQDKRVDLNSNSIVIDLLKLCNPYERLDNDNYHDAHIKMVRIMKRVKEGIPKDKLSCSFSFGAE